MMDFRTLVHANTVKSDAKQLFHFQLKLFLFSTGAPVYISNPHFYQSDPKFLKEVEGLSPKKELHETYFKIQPVRSYPL